MNLRFSVLVSLLSIACMLIPSARVAAAGRDRVPILVELFTSEGCSSCPPADRFLQKLDEQPVAGAQLIVLSEHVDYWNHDGWKDPFSSGALTERQRVYSTQFHLDTVYTPQMVLDGSSQFTGSDVNQAQKAIAESLPRPKIALQVSDVSAEDTHLQARLETGSLDSSYGVKSADVYIVVAQNHAESQVLRGENANRHLSHAAVVRKLAKVGKIKLGEKFAQQIELKLDFPLDPHNLRIVAFLQDPASGRIVGATMKAADTTGFR